MSTQISGTRSANDILQEKTEEAEIARKLEEQASLLKETDEKKGLGKTQQKKANRRTRSTSTKESNMNNSDNSKSRTRTRPTSGSPKGDPKKGVLPSKVAKMATKAEQIRTLRMAGWTRLQVARALGISFQHVYNTDQRPTKTYDPSKLPKAKA